jgi:hypothetical protein
VANTILICRDALEDSVLGNLAVARAIGQNGGQATVIFTGEALAALDTGTFAWSENFKTREARSRIIASAEAAGFPLADKERDPRWSDVRGMVRDLAGESGVRLVACPVWSRLLGIDGQLDHLEHIEEAQLVALLQEANTVVGGY